MRLDDVINVVFLGVAYYETDLAFEASLGFLFGGRRRG